MDMDKPLTIKPKCLNANLLNVINSIYNDYLKQQIFHIQYTYIKYTCIYEAKLYKPCHASYMISKLESLFLVTTSVSEEPEPEPASSGFSLSSDWLLLLWR